MNRMFEEDEDVAVMEPMVGTKKRKTVYVKGIRSVHSEMDFADLTVPDQVRDDGSWHSTILYPPAQSTDDEEVTYVNVEELAQQLRKTGVYLLHMYKQINGWIVKAVEAKRKITISFKDASVETMIDIGAIIGDMYSHFPEEQIDEFMCITDLDSFGQWRLTNSIRMARLYRDDPVAHAKIEEKVLKIMEGNY
jgi:hypothetical protein